ncbi:DUF4755 domain-containing protein [Limnohabitans sp.]|uniref:DUF4755 domain-containing protein n=1 Tax=Limnohabitans sp. TaxID=1907725 RepID=UPI0028A0255B|nr:DUF4755 domain-containing protein [Limnohabitans sp.]
MEALGFLVVLIGGLWLWSTLKDSNTKDAQFHEYLQKIENCKYLHHYKRTAIAVDPKQQKLHLYADENGKTYDFSDVREWKYAYLTGGQILGAAPNLASAAQTIGANNHNHRNNVNGSGLFIEVRDIDHPKWHIQFQYNKHMEKELLRWMEILRQSINESN